MTDEKRGPGRPKSGLPVREKHKSVRFTADELEEVSAAAQADDKTPVTRWIADAALEKARRTRP